MSKTLLIIISGLPCTGKTILGRKIAKEFRLPFVSKDDIKESLFDDLGWKDREWSKKLGVATYTILYYFMESLLSAGRSFIVESNFKPEFENERFLMLKKKYAFEPFQIMCKTKGEILFERFKIRSESGERHPGHVDHLNYEEFKETLLTGKLDSLDIGGTVFDIDTTDFDAIDYEKLFSTIRAATNSI
ncbi:MAG: ATP-binding protein [Candidatus Uhrbacteria bacterium]|nr:ATP-binding protein [Candidatus Uhrbacteria bacterium]